MSISIDFGAGRLNKLLIEAREHKITIAPIKREVRGAVWKDGDNPSLGLGVISYISVLRDSYPDRICMNADDIFLYDVDLNDDGILESMVQDIIHGCVDMEFHIGVFKISKGGHDAHANALVSHIPTKTMCRFEPHGVASYYDGDFIDDGIEQHLKKEGWKYIRPINVCPTGIGPQTVQANDDGFCGSWSLYFIDRWIDSEGRKKPTDIVQEILRDKTPEELDTIIRQFRSKIGSFSHEKHLKVENIVYDRTNMKMTHTTRESIKAIHDYVGYDENHIANVVIMRLSKYASKQLFLYKNDMFADIPEPHKSAIAQRWLRYVVVNNIMKFDERLFQKFLSEEISKSGVVFRYTLEDTNAAYLINSLERYTELPLKKYIVLELMSSVPFQLMKNYLSDDCRSAIVQLLYKTSLKGVDIVEDYRTTIIAQVARGENVPLDDAKFHKLVTKWLEYLCSPVRDKTTCKYYILRILNSL